MRKFYRIVLLLSCMVFAALSSTAQVTVVAWNFTNSPDDAIADAGTPANLTRMLVTRGGTSAVDFANPGFTTNAANATGWDHGAGTKYWMISFDATGFTTLLVSSKQRSNNDGPKYFKLQYTLDTSTAWIDIPAGGCTVGNNWVAGFLNNVTLPPACNNQPLVFIRWITTDTTAVTGGPVLATGTNRIDDITVTGSTSYVPAYAAIPYNMTFESPWMDGNDSADIPSLNWLNTPDSGNNSWRRDDNQSVWSWPYNFYTPSGALGTVHAARFHSYGANYGQTGTLDLYLNLSPAGAKMLTYYYINNSGSDYCQVLLSTDGGATFTPVDMAQIAPVWTKRMISLGNTTSSTCILRFLGFADYGNDDIGIDEVSVGPPPADDAGAVAIVSPGYALNPGNHTVKVNIKNFGTAHLTSVTIGWTVNGNTQAPHNWSGNLAPLAEDDSITLGTINFISGNYLIKAWTENPNGNPDISNLNDTCGMMVILPAFASLPFYEGFDSVWINKHDTADVPSIYWDNNPAFGNVSWRRDDEGDLGNWYQSNLGMYNPAGALSTPHSARFHTYWANANQQGTLDLYMNFSPPGIKQMSFYAINTDGADSLVVMISTNGGSTFNPIGTCHVQPVWTKFMIPLGASVSSDVIIRFLAISDFGYTDFGLDEVRVYLPTPDVAVTEKLHPSSGCGLGTAETVTVKVANYGPNAESNIPITRIIDGNMVTETVPGPIASCTTVNFSFAQTADFSAPGIHHCKFYTGLLTDSNHSNDTLTTHVSSVGNITTFPFLENFESGNNFYLNLFAADQAGIAIQHGIGNMGSTGLRLTGKQMGTWPANTGNSTTHNDAWNVYTAHHSAVFTCTVDAGTLGSPELLLDLRQRYSTGPLYSWFRVLINDTIQISNTNAISDFNPTPANNDPYNTQKFDLQAWAGQIFKITLQASCKYDSTYNGGDDAFIDNIIIRDKPLNDMAALGWVSPAGGECGMMPGDSVRVKLANAGIHSLNHIPVFYSTDNGVNWVTDTVFSTLNSGDTILFTFHTTADFSVTGLYHCIVRTGLAGDNDSTNDRAYFELTSVPTITIFPYIQNFEAGFTGWTSFAQTGTSWAAGTPSKPIINSAHSGVKAWVTGLTDPYSINTNSFVVSPCMDFTGLTNPQLSVWLNINTESGWDAAVMETSVNDSAWVQFPGDMVFYNDNQAMGTVIPPKWSGSSNGWKLFSTALTGFAGKSKVRFRFHFQSDYSVNGEGIALDDIIISDPLSIDAAMVGLEAPLSGTCNLSATETIQVKVANAGANPINNVQVSFSADGGSWVTEVMPSIIPTGDTMIYTFTGTANLSANGMHSIRLAAAEPNDPDYFNDTAQAFVFRNFSITQIPFYENFDGVNKYFGLMNNLNSEVGLLNGAGVAGSFSLYFTGGQGGTWPGGTSNSTTALDAWNTYVEHQAEATTCSMTFSPTHTLCLRFKLRQTYSTGPKYSWFRVMANDSQLADTNGITDFNPTTASTDTFHIEVFDLTPYTSSPFTITLQGCNKYSTAVSSTGIGDVAYIDDLRIFDTTWTGIHEYRLPFPVCYPNPTTGKVYVNLNARIEKATMDLYDVNGKLVLSVVIRESDHSSIDLAGFPKGLYCLVIRTENSVATVKLLKQ